MVCLGGSVDRATALKAGGRGLESHLSSLFFYENRKIEKRVLSGLLPCLPLKSKFTCIHVNNNYNYIYK